MHVHVSVISIFYPFSQMSSELESQGPPPHQGQQPAQPTYTGNPILCQLHLLEEGKTAHQLYIMVSRIGCQ